jgi:hypothetical protein
MYCFQILPQGTRVVSYWRGINIGTETENNRFRPRRVGLLNIPRTCINAKLKFQFNSIYLTFIIVTIATLEQVLSLTITELLIKFYITIKFTLSAPIKYIMFTI